MGLLDGLLAGLKPGPNERRVAANVAILQQRHGEPARRYQAAEKLVEWKTPAAIEGLLLRFTVNAAADTSDEEEKAYVADLIVEKIGKDAVGPIERYLRRKEQVAWPLRVLARVVTPEEYRRKVVAALSALDTHFDPQPERKVEMIHSLVEHASDPAVPDAVARFLDDTDDTVRGAAIELLARTGREQDAEAIVNALVASPDRARVRAAACEVLLDVPGAVKGRKAEVEPLLPEGFYVTREGTLKRLGK